MQTPEKMAAKGLRVGLAPKSELASMSGLEMIQAMARGELPMAPMAGVIPMAPHAAEYGKIEFRAWPEERFFNPMGIVHGGWAMTLLDTALAIAAHTTVKTGELSTSLDTSVKFTRPILATSGEMRIFGEVITRGRSIMTVEGRVVDERDRIFATATSTCMVLQQPAAKT